MGMIFVSYRREDAAGEARALFSSLAEQLGAGSAFMDVDNIALGRDFRDALNERLNDCDVLLALIGKGWLTSKNRQGKPRLEDSNDFVRLEILAALKRNIPVTPVLVQDAEMPSADQLPEELRDFAYRNAFELSHARWESDVREMVRRLGLVRQAPAARQAPAVMPVVVPATKAPASGAARPAAGGDHRPGLSPDTTQAGQHGSSSNPVQPYGTATKLPMAAVAMAVVAAVGGGAWLLSARTPNTPSPSAQQPGAKLADTAVAPPVNLPVNPPISQAIQAPTPPAAAAKQPTLQAEATATPVASNPPVVNRPAAETVAINKPTPPDGAAPATSTAANTAPAATAVRPVETAPSYDGDFRQMFNSGFVYCDAKLLAAHWNIDIGEAKNRIGRLIRDGELALVRTRLSEAFTRASSGRGARCEFVDTGYSFADAKKLAAVWGVSVAEAKATVERKFNAGASGNVRRALRG